MTGSECRSTRKDWNAAGSSGHHRRMALFRSQLRNSLICLKGSIGGTRNEPGGRSWRADGYSVPILRRFCVHDHGPVCSDSRVNQPADTLPNDIDVLKAALLAERTARLEMQARASGA